MGILELFKIAPIKHFALNRLRQQTIAPYRKQIFLMHSSKDGDLIALIKENFPPGMNPYFARQWREARIPLDKIVDQLCASSAAFVLWTRNVAESSYTRDWVLFELGVAKTLVEIGLLSGGIWGWHSEDAELTDLMKSITEFAPFQRWDTTSCLGMVMEMKDIALQV